MADPTLVDGDYRHSPRFRNPEPQAAMDYTEAHMGKFRSGVRDGSMGKILPKHVSGSCGYISYSDVYYHPRRVCFRQAQISGKGSPFLRAVSSTYASCSSSYLSQLHYHKDFGSRGHKDRAYAPICRLCFRHFSPPPGFSNHPTGARRRRPDRRLQLVRARPTCLPSPNKAGLYRLRLELHHLPLERVPLASRGNQFARQANPHFGISDGLQITRNGV